MTGTSARSTGAGPPTMGSPWCPRSPVKTNSSSLPASRTVTHTIADPRMWPASRNRAVTPGAGGMGGPDDPGQKTRMVQLGVRGEDEIDRGQRDGKGPGVLRFALGSALEHPAVDEEPHPGRLDQDARAGYLPRRAQRRYD